MFHKGIFIYLDSNDVNAHMQYLTNSYANEEAYNGSKSWQD